jgi:hypothetical protein
MPRTRWIESEGMSLVDATVASGVLIVAVVSLAQLFVLSSRSTAAAARLSTAAVLAAQKLEELRALQWSVDTSGTTLSDTATDTSVVPHAPAGGTGLTVTSCSALLQSTPGYVDYWSELGAWVEGRGADPPAGSAFARRWCIGPLAADPVHTLVLQARVVPVAGRGGADPDRRTRLDEAWLVTVRTRRAE